MADRFALNGKHILVTGASSGIGKACALLFGERGARVTLVARNEERLNDVLSQLKNGGASYSYDLSDVDGIEALFKRITTEQGKLDGMMYCAGDCQRAPISACKPKMVRESMQVNYFAFLECLRCFSKAKNFNPGASIVAMSSSSSLKGDRGLTTLSAAKAAMNSAVRCACKEFASKGIRVNAIATAYINGTSMIETTLEVFGEEHCQDFITQNQPLGMGKPEYIADAAAYLLSDAAGYITGAINMVDGGYIA